MKKVPKAVLVVLLHLAIIGTLYGKYSYERATRPRVWVKTIGFDPDLPIRGRYVSLGLEVATDVPAKAEGDPKYRWYPSAPVHLEIRDGKLFAASDPDGKEFVTFRDIRETTHTILSENVLYFLPEHATDPTRRVGGEELWVEVTLPKKGPPRPIRLGVKKDGPIEPLQLN